MSTLNGMLAAAIRKANALYAQHPEPRPDVIGATWTALEDDVDTAIASGDEDRARRAIAAWSEHVERELGGRKVTEARGQLHEAIQVAVRDSINGLADELADRVAERIANGSGASDPEWISAAEVARRYRCSRDWVYANKERLGGVPLSEPGNGRRPRWRFDPGKVAEALMARPNPATEPKRPTPRRRPRRAESDAKLLPIREAH